jgi:HlyD family secretion protein
MSCNSDIKVNSKINVLAIPIQSITARDEMKDKIAEENPDEPKRTSEENLKKKEKPKEVVFVIEDTAKPRVKIILVKTGISDDKYIEITEGLNPDMIIVKGPYKAISKELENGTKVKVDNEMKKKITGSE